MGKDKKTFFLLKSITTACASPPSLHAKYAKPAQNFAWPLGLGFWLLPLLLLLSLFLSSFVAACMIAFGKETSECSEMQHGRWGARGGLLSVKFTNVFHKYDVFCKKITAPKLDLYSGEKVHSVLFCVRLVECESPDAISDAVSMGGGGASSTSPSPVVVFGLGCLFSVIATGGRGGCLVKEGKKSRISRMRDENGMLACSAMYLFFSSRKKIMYTASMNVWETGLLLTEKLEPFSKIFCRKQWLTSKRFLFPRTTRTSNCFPHIVWVVGRGECVFRRALSKFRVRIPPFFRIPVQPTVSQEDVPPLLPVDNICTIEFPIRGHFSASDRKRKKADAFQELENSHRIVRNKNGSILSNARFFPNIWELECFDNGFVTTETGESHTPPKKNFRTILLRRYFFRETERIASEIPSFFPPASESPPILAFLAQKLSGWKRAGTCLLFSHLHLPHTYKKKKEKNGTPIFPPVEKNRGIFWHML